MEKKEDFLMTERMSKCLNILLSFLVNNFRIIFWDDTWYILNKNNKDKISLIIVVVIIIIILDYR